MKKRIIHILILFLFTIIFCCYSHVSNNSRDIEFMEIPIKGDVYSFGSKLEKKGYQFYDEDKIYCQLIYYGNYLNKKATIRLDYEEESKEIKSARVIFHKDIPSASALINEYTEKYGECKMEPKYGFVYYTWVLDGGKLVIGTCDSPILSIEYHRE